MGRISTNIGLITGFPITETVDKLVSLEARSRDLLVAKNKTIESQKNAVTQLTALLISLQFTTNKLTTASLYQQRTVTSSNEDLLMVTSTGQPPLGAYQVTPIQVAQSQQLQSSRFTSSTAPLGAGKFTFRHGGFIDSGASLDLLKSGEGFSRGRIRVTDRSGASSEIDLSYARDIDDVLKAINSNGTINVRAEVRGDRIALVDLTGQSVSNLKVQEVGGGQTADSLGLNGLDVAGTEALGQDVLGLFDDLGLEKLNSGNGIRLNSALPDVKVTFRDGTEAEVDFRRLGVAGTKAEGTTNAAAGANAQVVFTAVNAGSAYSGVTVTFVNDNSVVKGQETVTFDSQAKTLQFRIDEGQTTADDIVAALQRNETAKAAFTARRASGANGSGLINIADTAITVGPKAMAITPNSSGDARVVFTAKQGGAAFDGVQISFVDNPAITAGQETVVYDDSNPNNKKLIFQIDAENTSANQVIAALNNDPLASVHFGATKTAGSNGTGKVLTTDTVTTSGGAMVEPVAGGNEQTIGEVLATLNAAAPGKLKAEIAADGDRIVLTDLTSDTGGTFALTALNGSKAILDLGLATTDGPSTITGRRLQGGLKSSLLANMAGGAGISSLGGVSLTDRSGASAAVDLSAAETLDDVIRSINSAGIGIAARVNDARNGLTITDTSGGTGSLIISSSDAQQSAEKLKIAGTTAASTRASGTLNLQVVSETTRLATLNGGKGVGSGTINIRDSAGKSVVIDITSEQKTIGDVIDEINATEAAVTARINDAGDGILIIDTADGSGDLAITAGSGTAARDLHLLAKTEKVTIDGVEKQVVNGSTAYTITLDGTTPLSGLASKINQLEAGVQVSILNDGSSVKPFRFTLFNQSSGKAGELLFDTSEAGFSLAETVQAKDALLLLGTPGSSDGLLASSSTNSFNSILPDMSLVVRGAATAPVTVSVGASDSNLIAAIEGVVESYNKVVARVAEYTKYDEATNKSAVLQGDGSALRVDTDLSNFVSGRIFGAGEFQSFEAIGIKVKDDGTLELDENKLKNKISDNPTGVKEFLSKAETGVSARFQKLIEQLAGVDRSLLVNRAVAFEAKFTANKARIEFLNARLEGTRKRLLLQFQRSELAISKMQGNLSAIASMAPITTPTGN